ncbi:hypothetical protein TREMEDRAFT_59813 [Tremella mesenterica DSM 1558]|uniref:uncharacterized protein n=1 Tax=Tremella mesenterica (strain ATCC 24925 / CBS 8224 / DSM 1558 / NBRC 9311 / NRRL Y-6157 / RJB 2259-6 / UBC 559-6) TaxID=578456 RepID=UPI0003F49BE5|nr:uncharacterized protein TREMEDRAFT_59813 [Tremella mesenterica DSM 1558]EIW73640.1 hypothetical protein TREMEDRAFT_59813 [Tremella mesenterica DSM 1558]
MDKGDRIELRRNERKGEDVTRGRKRRERVEFSIIFDSYNILYVRSGSRWRSLCVGKMRVGSAVARRNEWQRWTKVMSNLMYVAANPLLLSSAYAAYPSYWGSYNRWGRYGYGPGYGLGWGSSWYNPYMMGYW